MHPEIRLICFDLNKTLIRENTWYNLNLALGVSHAEDQALLQQYEAGTLRYHSWLDILMKKYQESGTANRETIERVVRRYTFLPGAREAVHYVKKQGYHTALVTGAMDILAEEVALELGIDHWRAHHQFIFDTENRLTDITILGDEQQTKVDQLQEICNELDISLTQCACVGDGDNDVALFKATAHGITFKESRVASQAWRVIADLTELSTVV